MFFILSKTLGILLNPLIILLVLLLLSLWLKKPLLKRLFLGMFIFCFILFSNSVITNEVMRWWEVAGTPFLELEEKYDAAVVLSGVTASKQAPFDRVHLHKGADRIMHAVHLYKLGKVGKIVLSGGSGLLKADSISEAERMKRVMLLSGIPQGDIVLEEQSRNTHENAAYSRLVLDQHFPQGKYLLVTSAFHMPRATACFQKAGIPVQAFATDFYSKERDYSVDEFIIPNADAMSSWGRLIREWFGLLTYKLMGYA